MNQATLGCFIANVLWGSTFLFSKILLERYSPATICIVRFSIASVAMLLICCVSRGVIKQLKGLAINDYVYLFVYAALVIPGVYLTQLVGLQYISSGHSAFLANISPFVTCGLAIAIFHEKLRLNQIVGFVLAMAALMPFLNTQDDATLLGYTMSVLSALSLGISSVWIKWKLSRIQPVLITAFSFIIGLPMLMAFSPNVVFFQIIERMSVTDFGIFIALALLCTVISFLLWNWAAQRVSPITLSAAMLVKLPVAIVLGSVFYGEHNSIYQMLGMLGVLLGAYLITYKGKGEYRFLGFAPDVVVELIKLCNMRCHGCYSNNMSVGHNFKMDATLRSGLIEKNKMLSPHVFKCFLEATLPGEKVALRGGEPTLYPDLIAILMPHAQRGVKFIIESNGLWLVDKNAIELKSQLLSLPGVEIKLSVDPMHHTSRKFVDNALKDVPSEILSFAVTTATEEECVVFCDKMGLRSAHKIYWQPLVNTVKDLNVGCNKVVQIDGSLIRSFSDYSVAEI